MKIQKFSFQSNEIIQIYISKFEYNDTKTIEEIKKQYSNISFFISGEQDTANTIKAMLNYEKNKKIK